MKLYYSPGACSLSPHIVLRELDIPFSLERVEHPSKITESGEDYRAVNPKGYVPALRFDDGEVLTEGAAIVQYLADSNPAAELAPKAGSRERAQLQAHLNYISSELHKAFTPLFQSTTADSAREAARVNVAKKLDYLEGLFSDGRSYLLGDGFSVADPYLFAVIGWTAPTGIDLAQWPHLAAFAKRMNERPAVKAALAAEGLAA
ncbi:glutathione transferase GstA [Escherichia coli]|nr:glutathione transferase GstA [Escherichia coli]